MDYSALLYQMESVLSISGDRLSQAKQRSDTCMAYLTLRNINKIYPNGFHAVHD